MKRTTLPIISVKAGSSLDYFLIEEVRFFICGCADGIKQRQVMVVNGMSYRGTAVLNEWRTLYLLN